MEVKGRAKNLIFGDHWGKLKSNYQAENQGKKETFHFILRPARRCSLSPSYERGQEEERSLSKTQRSKTWSKQRISLQCYRLRFRIFFFVVQWQAKYTPRDITKAFSQQLRKLSLIWSLLGSSLLLGNTLQYLLIVKVCNKQQKKFKF